MKIDYTELKKFIKENPKIRKYTNFIKGVQKYPSNIYYYIGNELPMDEKIAQAYAKKYNLTEEQVDRFFYSVKVSKRKQ